MQTPNCKSFIRITSGEPRRPRNAAYESVTQYEEATVAPETLIGLTRTGDTFTPEAGPYNPATVVR